MSDITREQYDNAVRIRDNGYSCRDPIHLDCTKCFGYSLPCGNEGNLIDDRVAIVGSTISTYEAEHPEEFRKPPRIYDYRDVGLPEVQALIGHDVYASDVFGNIIELLGFCVLKTLDNVNNGAYPFSVDQSEWQFIRATDSPKIKLTRAELIAIAAERKGVKPEQIEVEE